MSNIKKIILILVGAGVVLWGAVWVINYFQYRNSPEYQAKKYLDDIEKKYREDTYGGSTPEETLQLFINALKAGDTDLASKYFVVEKQEEWREDLKIGKENGSINLLLGILEKPRKGKEIFEGSYLYSISSKGNNVIDFSISLIKNKFTNKWKIESL